MKNKKFSIKLGKRGKALILSLVLVAGGGGALALNHSEPEPIKIENEMGHDDINPVLNWNVDEDDFVLLNVGDHDSVGTLFQERKISMCNEQDISLGIIINSNAKDECSIYNDVEYVKGLVRDNKIDFPVYLNIDSIITDDSLNIEMKTKIMNDFLQKCSANNIYVGIAGTDTNLCRCKKYCGITGYDAYLVMDSDTIKYDGTCNVIKDVDGNIKSSVDLAEVIKRKKLNNDNYYSNDGSYVLAEGETITDVSLKYGISVDELLEFNNLKKKEIIPGTLIRIPSIIDTSKPDVEEYETLDVPIRGCDISYCQGNSTDWNQIANNFEYVILKCNQGVDVDDYFENNAVKCNVNNIPIGVYCYNGYSRYNCHDDMDLFNKKQNEQVECTLNLLKNKKVDYPVYLDIECSGGLSSSYLTQEQVRSMLDIWINRVSEAGYLPGLYCNQSGFRYLQSCVDYDLSSRFQVWISGGDQYYSDKRDIDLNDVVASSVLYDSSIGATMAQSTDSCVNAGSYDGSGHLDINFSSIDYSKPITTDQNDKNFDIKEFNRLDFRIPACCIGLAGLSAIGIGIAKKIRKKKIR